MADSPAISIAHATFEKVKARQKHLGWSDEQLLAFANQHLTPLDPYGRLKISSIEFLSRLSPNWQKQLLALMGERVE